MVYEEVLMLLGYSFDCAIQVAIEEEKSGGRHDTN